ncbi:MAG: hypothetical protein ACJA02_000159 [Myxococcota bacterium]
MSWWRQEIVVTNPKSKSPSYKFHVQPLKLSSTSLFKELDQIPSIIPDEQSIFGHKLLKNEA